jgi:hypothetical protein
MRKASRHREFFFEWNYAEKAQEQINSLYTTLTPVDGLLTLEFQSYLYPFLVRCCKAILPVMSHGQLFTAPIPAQEYKISVDSMVSPTSLVRRLSQAPFRIPDSLDVTYIEKCREACSTSAENEIDRLKTMIYS